MRLTPLSGYSLWPSVLCESKIHRSLARKIKKAGAAEETRTPYPIITNDVLYQLSYSGTYLVQI